MKAHDRATAHLKQRVEVNTASAGFKHAKAALAMLQRWRRTCRKVSGGSAHNVFAAQMQQQRQLSLAAPAAHHNHHL
jgi:hypothetical protein